MVRYRKKPVTIDAFRLDPGADPIEFPPWFREAFELGDVYFQGGDDPYVTVETLEGVMIAVAGDWIIRGVKGEIYPCKPEIFELTYEPVDAE